MSFTKAKNKICHFYQINNNVLTSVDTFKDLGVTFDKKLTFDSHVERLYTDCLKLTNYLFRQTQNIKDIDTTVSLDQNLSTVL